MIPPKPAAERPATFGNVFAEPEYRALFAASATSWFGDNLARAAATALVFTVTDSVLLSAASFAISYLPGITCGPLLAALAERYPHRQVMITCDLIRAVLISLVAIPHLPVPAILLLLFATALLNPAFDASRAALLPRVLEGDRYVMAVSMQTTTGNIAMVCGYLLGGALAPFHPHLAMLIDGATFALSGAILAASIRPRPVIAKAVERRRLITETIAGFRLVFGDSVLRQIAAVVFFAGMFAVVPEGLAAAWASVLSNNGGARGFDQALIMAASPVGAVTGAVVVARFIAPATRQKILRPLAVLIPAALVPAFLVHTVAVIGILTAISAFAINGLSTTANGLFVRALPVEFRARAFGVMQFGIALFQAIGLLVAGSIAGYVSVPVAVTIFSLIGVGVMTAICLTWPTLDRLNETFADVKEHNTQTLAAAEAASGDGDTTTGRGVPAQHGAARPQSDSRQLGPSGPQGMQPRPGVTTTASAHGTPDGRTAGRNDGSPIPAPAVSSDTTAGVDGHPRPTSDASDRMTASGGYPTGRTTTTHGYASKIQPGGPATGSTSPS